MPDTSPALECSILIPNYNSSQAIQLCIESIKVYTHYPNYRIIVYDDCSTNGIDLDYLRLRQEQGWITLIEGQKNKGHGHALNVLVNEACTSPYALIMDCDVQILAHNWLIDLMLYMVSSESTILVCNNFPGKRRNERTFLFPFCELWFGLLNMEAYHNDMEVDWQIDLIKSRKTIRQVYGIEDPKVNNVVLDVGSKLMHKVLFNNPLGYKIVRLPRKTERSFHHFRQISSLSDNTNPQFVKWMNRQMAVIQSQLQQLREENDFLAIK